MGTGSHVVDCEKHCHGDCVENSGTTELLFLSSTNIWYSIFSHIPCLKVGHVCFYICINRWTNDGPCDLSVLCISKVKSIRNSSREAYRFQFGWNSFLYLFGLGILFPIQELLFSTFSVKYCTHAVQHCRILHQMDDNQEINTIQCHYTKTAVGMKYMILPE